MPVVINEFELSVQVTPDGNEQSGSSSSLSGSSREDIIKECIEKVMEILNQKNER